MLKKIENGLVFILLGGTILAATLTTYKDVPTIIVSSICLGGGIFWVVNEIVNRKD